MTSHVGIGEEKNHQKLYLHLILFEGWQGDYRKKPFLYYGVPLKVEELPPCGSIQLTVYDKDGLHHNILAGGGLNMSKEPKDLPDVAVKSKKDGKCIYTISYHSPEGKL